MVGIRVLSAAVVLALALGLPATSRAAAEDDAASPHDAQWRKFRRRRIGLAVGVGLSAAVTLGSTLGLVLGIVEQRRCVGICDAIGPIVVPPIFISAGAISTAATGAALAHHERWDDPVTRHATDAGTLALAHRRRRDLAIGMGVSGGIAAIGIALMAFTPLVGRRCVDAQAPCRAPTATFFTGVALLPAGAVALIATGTAFGLHVSHGHDSPRRVQVSPGAGGLTVRF